MMSLNTSGTLKDPNIISGALVLTFFCQLNVHTHYPRRILKKSSTPDTDDDLPAVAPENDDDDDVGNPLTIQSEEEGYQCYMCNAKLRVLPPEDKNMLEGEGSTEWSMEEAHPKKTSTVKEICLVEIMKWKTGQDQGKKKERRSLRMYQGMNIGNRKIEKL